MANSDQALVVVHGAADIQTGPAAIAPLLAAFDRLEDVLDVETTALQQRIAVDYNDFGLRKSRSLLELTRIARVVESSGPLHPDVAARLPLLQAKLELNQELLAIHLAAAREVAEVIAAATQAAESDGTYSASIAQQGGGR